MGWALSGVNISRITWVAVRTYQRLQHHMDIL